MNLFCFIQVQPVHKIVYKGNMNDFFKRKSFLVFEADNHSDPYLMEQGKALIEKSNTIVLHIDAMPSENLGNLKMLFEALRKVEVKIFYQMEYTHPKLMKILSFIKAKEVEDLKNHFNSN